VVVIAIVHLALVRLFLHLAPGGHVTLGPNPGTVVGGVFFLFWAAVFAASWRWPHQSAILALLNRGDSARVLAVIFALVGFVLFLVGFGVLA
jgi:hypothetical protein